LLLVYEYMENNSLARALFGKYFSSISSYVWPSFGSCKSMYKILY
jgi:hypothetical protein